MISLFDWQIPSARALMASVAKYGVGADGSEMGTGKTYKVCYGAAQRGKPIVVLCPKSVREEWQRVAALFGVSCEAVNYERVRAGKTKHGRWQVKGKVFEWTIPVEAELVFDEAHRCGGQGTQNAAMLIAAKRQRIPMVLLSGTLISSPLKAYAIGFALDLHRLTNFWPWARANGVTDGFFGPEWKPDDPEAIMQKIRVSLGDKFTRIRKSDVPGFPECQTIPTFVTTEEMPDLESDYGVEARAVTELLKVPGLVEKAKDLIEEGMSVAIFVNFRATLAALQEALPKAVSVYGGQTASERSDAINSFQQNTTEVILLMSQAGGTGISLHDLHGRPRAALICPGYDAVEFLQVLGRIHRAGARSNALNFIIFASGVPVERRIRARLEAKLTNMTALNDFDLGAPKAASPEPETLPMPRAKIIHGVIDVTTTVINSSQAPVSPTAPDPVSSPTQEPAQAPVAHVERKHARCSPSKLKNLEICPSYEADNDAPVHPVTLRGTAMHEALETADDSKLIEGEQELVDMCREFLKDELEWAAEVISESHLKTHDPDVQGFVDLFLIGPTETRIFEGQPKAFRRAKIRDFKMGWNLVDTPDLNPQAIAYTVGAFIGDSMIEEINFAFLIPRQDAVLEHTFYRSELPALKLRLSVIADRVRKLAGKEFNLVESNCLYCGLKHKCPATLGKMLPIRNGVAEDERLPIPVSLDPTAVVEPKDMALMLNLASMAEAWAEKVRGAALRYRLELGQEIPGYDLIERQGKREVSDPVAAFAVAKDFGVTETEYLGAAKMSITSLERSVKEHAQTGDKAEAAGRFTDRLMDVNAITRGGSFHVLQRSRKKTKPAAPALPAAAA